MNNDMKCPVCNSYLHKIPVKEAWVCSTHDSKDELYGTKELWQELIRTRKALKIAIGALKEISLRYQNGLDKPVAPAKWFSIATDMCDYADNAIEQITALEQKDAK